MFIAEMPREPLRGRMDKRQGQVAQDFECRDSGDGRESD